MPVRTSPPFAHIRPELHLQPPANWLNDPNGFIRWGGRYHMFYQLNPVAPVSNHKHWGHASSTDLVSWVHHPIALAPSVDFDSDGCWSGCCVIHEGVPTFVYTGVKGLHPNRIEKVGIATSQDPLLEEWTVRPEPVIAGPPPGMKTVGWRDPFLYRDGDSWSLIIGSGTAGEGGKVLLYRSTDLIRWDYIGPFLDQLTLKSDLTVGPMWEFPQLVRLPGKDILIVSPLTDRTMHLPVHIEGRVDGDRFVAEKVGTMEAGRTYTSPAAPAEAEGRGLVFGWLHELVPQPTVDAMGWTGVLSFPREYGIDDDGRVRVFPPEELALLRRTLRQLVAPGVHAEGPMEFELEVGPFEIVLEADLQEADAVTLFLSASPPLAKPAQVEIVFDRVKAELSLVTRSDAIFAPIEAEAGGTLSVDDRCGSRLALRVLIDKSVVEIFANDHIVLSGRIYCEHPLRFGGVCTAGPAEVTRLDVWTLGRPPGA